MVTMIAHWRARIVALPVPGNGVLFCPAPPSRTMGGMTTTLITGATKGLGREAARRLRDAGHDVWIGARDAAAGQAVANELHARFVALDVTDDASVAAAVQTVRDAGTGLDVLVNNAGIAGSFQPVSETTADHVAAVHATNVLGVVRVTQAFLPLLEDSENPVVVNVSSGMGSLTLTTDPDRVESTIVGLAYPSSKAAVTMLTSQYARALPHMRINAADPGYTATDLNGHSGPQTVTEGTDAIVALAQLGPDGPTGTFVDRHGPVPW
jgi:NAD(P)-dependent dehydrogenase (short-subunit alcohol dehydrogenase family)